MNFRHLDLNLLRVLAAVYRTGSVTAAGQQLALSQPATSNALARLREFFGDELFVRSPRGLHPTRTAQRIAPAVIAHLQALETTVLQRRGVRPGREPRALAAVAVRPRRDPVPAAAGGGAAPGGAALPGFERRAWPRSRSAARSRRATSTSPSASCGRATAASPARRCFEERFVGITARDWQPPAGRAGRTLSAKQLAGAAVAVATPTATVHGSVDARLRQLKLADRAVLHVRHFGALPELVTRTDLLAIVPRMFAESLAPRYAVRIWELPDVAPTYDVRMLWHPSANGDAAHAWLRAQVKRLFKRGARAALRHGLGQRAKAPSA